MDAVQRTLANVRFPEITTFAHEKLTQIHIAYEVSPWIDLPKLGCFVKKLCDMPEAQILLLT